MFEALRFRALLAVAVAAAAGCSGSSGSPTSGQASLLPSSGRAAPGARLAHGLALVGSSLVPRLAQPWNLAHAWPDKKKQRQTLFICDPENNQVLMYDPNTPNPSPNGSITTGIDYPVGVAVDKKGTLYVANLMGGSPNNGSITVYKAGSSSPSLTITDGLVNPYSVAVDSHGNLFASNLDSNSIVGYRAGATSPFETISFSPYGQADGIATDANDNLWIANGFVNEVDEIPAGSSTPQDANLSGLNGPTDVSFGEKGVMYVSDFIGGAVSVYKSRMTSPWTFITKGIENQGPTYGGFTSSDYYFQTNQTLNVVGYKKGKASPFSTITGIEDPRGIASTPAVTK
ncbi:MAG TPA: hypothetical protein VK755_16330 [Candidatus Acidoferrales bacterium]|jgi:hypothetical protein|nr:hypothetical protein [Candidatus Acidoferrales bacterium]